METMRFFMLPTLRADFGAVNTGGANGAHEELKGVSHKRRIRHKVGRFAPVLSYQCSVGAGGANQE